MKKIILFFAVADLASMPVHADDITLTDGTVYKNATIINHSAVSATIETDKGGAIVPIEKLPKDVQAKLGYDPKAADDVKKQRAEALAEGEKQEALENLAKAISKAALQARGRIIQVVPDGILAELSAHHSDDKGRLVGGKWPQYDTSQYLGERVFVECDTAGLVDDAQWSGTIWKIGTFSYTNATGAMATIPKYTAIPESAVKALMGAPR